MIILIGKKYRLCFRNISYIITNKEKSHSNGEPNEADMHIFWDCPHTQLFWIEFSNVINHNVLQGFSLLFKDTLFGFFNIQNDQIN